MSLTPPGAWPCNPGSGGLQGAGYCEHQVLPGQASQGPLASARPAGAACSRRSPSLPSLPTLPFTFGQTPADRAAQEIFTLVRRRLLVLLLFLIPWTHRALSPMRVRSLTDSV